MDKWHEMICIDAGDVQRDWPIALNVAVAPVLSVDAHDAESIWIEGFADVRRHAQELDDVPPMVLKLQKIAIRDSSGSCGKLAHEPITNRLQ